MTRTKRDSSGWVQIDPSKFDRGERASRGDTAFFVYASPYDLPEAIRVHFSDQTKHLVFQFSYANPEPTETYKFDDHLRVTIGEKSHRVIEIETDVDATKRHEVIKSVIDAIAKLRTRSTAKRIPTGNYDLAQRVVEERGEDIMANLALSA